MFKIQILIYDTQLDVEDSGDVRSKVEVTGDDETMNVFLELRRRDESSSETK